MKVKKKAVKSSADLLREQIAEGKAQQLIEAEAHWNKVRDHVMLGQMKKGVLTGFHSIQKLGQKGCVAVITDGPKTNLKMGCYKRTIQSSNGASEKESTFFPDLWSEADIKAAVIDAYLHRVKGVGAVTIPKGNGMTILFMGEETAFPYFD